MNDHGVRVEGREGEADEAEAKIFFGHSSVFLHIFLITVFMVDKGD